MTLLYILTALMYCSLSFVEWMPLSIRTRCLGRSKGAAISLFLGSVLPALALCGHSALLYNAIFRPDALFFGVALGISAMLWLCMAMYWIESFFFSLEGFRRFIFPLAGWGCVLPALFQGVQILPYAAAPLFKVHFIIANMATGLFALLAVHAVLMLCIEHRLHGSMRGKKHPNAAKTCGKCVRFGAWLDTLPALMTLEKLLFRLMAMGWVLLSLTLLSGFLFSEQWPKRDAWGTAFLDQKTFFSLMSWLMFGAILAGHSLYGWRGRAALRWVLAAFGVLVLTYIASRWV